MGTLEKACMRSLLLALAFAATASPAPPSQTIRFMCVVWGTHQVKMTCQAVPTDGGRCYPSQCLLPGRTNLHLPTHQTPPYRPLD